MIGGADVVGVALWSPGQPLATAATARPAGRPRRRTSLITQMVSEVAAQAAAHAGLTLGRPRIVVGSAFGELGITVEMLGEWVDGGVLSPIRFQSSVHNSAAGALSIAHGNEAPAIALSAGNDTVAVALLEAMMMLRDGAGDVLVVIADEPLPGAIAPTAHTTALAAALVLAAPDGGASMATATAMSIGRRRLAHLSDLRRAPPPEPTAFRPVEVDAPCAAILPLLQAIRENHAGRISLAPPGIPGWSINVEPAPQPGPRTG
ncbi:MAG TPA: beta-ketoacyl synthase chain length factor [Polyangia bacterium]|nr:beta-ketoacyl synthase chain length factor [Polyangia bacterium]